MDIAKIFNSKARKELFRLYFTHPEKEYYLRELERLLDIPVSMIRKELMNLEREGIFASRKVANLLYYSINKSYPLFDELKSIVFKTVGVQGALKEVLGKIKGIDVAFIYGSFAKKSENASSDIDLFIIGEKVDDDRVLREIGRLEKTLKREISYSFYSNKEFNRKRKQKDSFILDVLEGPKIFLIGNKNDL